MKEKERRTDMLELRRVKKSYDGVTILEDINLKRVRSSSYGSLQ